MSGPGRCRRCGKPIIWALSQKEQLHAWDPEPSDRGSHVLVWNKYNPGSVTSRRPRRVDGPDPKLWISHTWTCAKPPGPRTVTAKPRRTNG